MRTEKDTCIFCKIVANEEESSKIYEDERILAFMDIRPIHEGEFMIIPKKHIDHFYDIPDDLAQHIMLHTQRLAKKLNEKFKPVRVGYVVHGFGVAHAHMVVIPLHERDDITSAKYMTVKENKIELDFNKVPFRNKKELDKIAEILRS